MTVYQSNEYRNKVATPGPTSANDVFAIPFTVTVGAALTTADTFIFGDVPKGFRLVDAILEATDMDTGTPALTLNVGDAGSATRLFAASTVAQAGTVARATAASAIHYQWTDKTQIVGSVQANPGTGAAGELKLTLIGFCDNLTSSVG